MRRLRTFISAYMLGNLLACSVSRYRANERTPIAAAAAPVIANVFAEPASIDFGEIPTGETATKMFALVNPGNEPATIVVPISSFSRHLDNVPPYFALAPHTRKEMKAYMNGGAFPGELRGKKITLVVEGQPDIEIPLKAVAISLVTQTPMLLTPESNPNGRLILTSRDGVPFHILSVQPPAVATVPVEARAEHVVTIDWAEYRKASIARKLIMYFDHPRCSSLMINVQFSVEEMENERRHLEDQAPKPAPNAASR